MNIETIMYKLSEVSTIYKKENLIPISYIKFSSFIYSKLKKISKLSEYPKQEYSSIYGVPFEIDDKIRDDLIVFYNNFDEVVNIIVWGME